MSKIKRDFRYEKDGSQIEAFQLTAASRYQGGAQPSWFESRWFMSVDNEEWLNINGREMRIPKYGWIVRDQTGNISVRDALEMEQWKKVQPDVRVVHPRADKGISDAAIAKANKIELPPDHVEPDTEVDEAEVIRPATVSKDDTVRSGLAGKVELMSVPNEIEAQPFSVHPHDTDGAISVMRDSLLALTQGEPDDAEAKLRDFLLVRANWCTCPPGRCEGKRDQWDCRKNSVLAN